MLTEESHRKRDRRFEERLKMKRRQILGGILIITVLLASGCGKTEGNAEGTGYTRMEGLDDAITASVSLDTGKEESQGEQEPESSDRQTGTDTENDGVHGVKEASGDEETEERELKEAADIYSRPEAEGTVVGSAKKGDHVQVIELTETGEWYKIVYQGRVAYVAADAVADRRGTQTAGNSRPGGTGQNPVNTQPPSRNQGVNPTPGPTPEPNQNPGSSGIYEPEDTPAPDVVVTPAPNETETPAPGETATPNPDGTTTPDPGETTPKPGETTPPTPGGTATPTPTPTPPGTVSGSDAGRNT